ncbi:MAG: sporulation initiation factor Spo0A C-terminal domain-containing protein [Defluviitaleaceae bacterium]|nr:sporulation initiation factor Spo0A C-terminal domain-containing protein [Defluviitaleaceae bacterium]
MNNRMSLLFIEDEPTDIQKFQALIKAEYDEKICLNMTDSSSEAADFTLGKKRPKQAVESINAVILDLELHKGEGRGKDYLQKIQGYEPRPIIVVVTNTMSAVTYNEIRDFGVELIYYKRQKGFSPKVVIDDLLDMWRAQGGIGTNVATEWEETESEKDERIRSLINDELNQINMSVKYNGRTHAADAIFLLINKKATDSNAVYNHVADEADITYSSVIRNVQTAINSAWDKGNADELSIHYTAPITAETGAPTPTEFIRFYADKIKKLL